MTDTDQGARAEAAHTIAEHLAANKDEIDKLIAEAHDAGNWQLEITLAALQGVLADRDRLAARVAELEAEREQFHAWVIRKIEELRAARMEDPNWAPMSARLAMLLDVADQLADAETTSSGETT